MSMLDIMLARMLDNVGQFISHATTMMLIILAIVPQLVPVVILGLYGYKVLGVMVDRSNREVKRMKDQCMAPILSNMAETVNARSLSRHDVEVRRFFLRRHFTAVDRYAKHTFIQAQLSNWCQLACYVISTMFVFFASSLFVFVPNLVAPNLAALALSYCFLIPYFLGFLANMIVMVNMALTSLERLLAFSSEDIPVEAAFEVEARDAPLLRRNW